MFLKIFSLYVAAGLKLRKYLPGLPKPENETIFNAAFSALNKSLTGSCHYVSEDPNLAVGRYYGGFSGQGALPAYGLTPENPADLQLGLMFAQTFNLKVNMKVNGHCMFECSGSALPNDGSTTLLFFMRKLNQVTVHQDFTDTCGTHTALVVRSGGGSTFSELYKALESTNTTFLGGTCRSVSAGGGWGLGTGMSYNQQRVFGLGIDNVIQYTSMLSSGAIVIVDRCSHPLLLKALRGGGGGFAVTISVVYPVWPGTQLQYYQFEIKNGAAGFNRTKWWELIVKVTLDPANKRWMIDPTAFSPQNWGYPIITDEIHKRITMPGYSSIITTFLGTDAEARQSTVFEDFKNEWVLTTSPSQRWFFWREFDSFNHWKVDPVDSGGIPVGFSGNTGPETWKKESTSNQIQLSRITPGTYNTWAVPDRLNHAGWPTFTGEWNIPMKFMREHPDESARIFERINNNITCNMPWWYHFGGNLPDMVKHAGEVVMNPKIWETGYNIGICEEETFKEVAKLLPPSVGGGPELNHMSATQNALIHTSMVEEIWGSENYCYMLKIKQMYDPLNIFGCKDCVAWPELTKGFEQCIFNPVYSAITTI